MKRFVTKEGALCHLLLFVCVFVAAPALAVGPKVEGQLVDVDGQPIAGATVHVLPYRSTFERRVALLDDVELASAAKAKTASDGHFAVVAPEVGMWVLRASSKGHVDTTVLLVPLLRDQQLLPIEVPQSRSMTIRAVGADGKAVSGALVMMDHQDQRRRGYSFRRQQWAPARIDRQVARTDEKGLAVVQVADGGKWIVRVASPGGLVGLIDDAMGARVEVTLPAGQPRSVLVKGDNGKPLPGVLLALGSAMVPIGRTDQEGLATVTWPGAGTAELIGITAEDQWGRETLEPLAENEPADTFVMTLETPVLVAGKVVSLINRDPVASALVWENADPANHALTDGKGHYQLRLFERPGQYLKAGALGFLDGGDAVTAAALDQGSGPSVVLQASFDQRGIVVDVEGQAVAGVRISAVRMGHRGAITSKNMGDLIVQSGPDGRFVLGPLPAEVPLRLEAKRQGYAQASVEVAAVAPGAVAPVARIELYAGQRGFGFVLDGDEQPVAGANVSLVRGLPAGATFDSLHLLARQEPTLEVSAAGGGFVFADLGPGSYDLAVDSVGFAPFTIPGIVVAAGEAETDLGTILLEPGASIEGVVVDLEDRPLVDAEIRVNRSSGMRIDVMISMATDEDRPVVRTGVDGRFEVSDLSPGKAVELSVKRAGYTTVNLQSVKAPSDEPVRVVLEPAGRISGVVVDGQNTGVEGARVALLHEGLGIRGRIGRNRLSFDTDKEGRFDAEEVAAGKWRISVKAPGYQDAERGGIEIESGETHAPVRIALEKGAVLEGKILDATGVPLVGAVVREMRETRAGMNWAMGYGGEQVMSEGEGTYRLDRLAPGATSIVVEHGEHRKQVRDIEIRLGDNNLDFRLERGFTIRGEVVDQQEGNPIAGARISAQPASVNFMSFSASEVISGADGTFEVEGLDEGLYTVGAKREGYASATTEEPVLIAGDSVGGVVLQLGSGATLTGRILGLDLDDLARVTVIAHSQSNGGMPSMAQVDFEGRYRIENLAPGFWSIMASLDMGGATANEQRTIEPGDKEIEVDLDLGGSIDFGGQVLLADTAPAVGYRIMATGAAMSSFGHGQTDGQGRFLFEGMKPGPHDFTVHSPAELPVHQETFDVADGDELTIKLETFRAVAGRVVDALDGMLVDGAEVSITVQDSDVNFFGALGGSIMSDGAGRFQFDQIAPGRYRITARKDGYGVATSDVEIQEAEVGDVELRMEPSGGFTLFVQHASGRRVGYASVVALDPGEQVVLSGQYSAGENGRVRLPDLPEGSWTLMVAADGSPTVERAVQSPGPTLTVQMPEGGGILATVPALADAGLTGKVRALDAQGRPYRYTRLMRAVDAWDVYGGLARIAPIPAGTWVLELTLPDGTIYRGVANVVPGVNAEVTLQ